MKRSESIHSLMETIERCMRDLRVTVSPSQVEQVVFLLYFSLKPQARIFHSIRHALDLTRDDHPGVSLAALFHDLVYYQIDEGFNPEVSQIISDYVREEREEGAKMGKVFLRDDLSLEDPIVCLNLSLFNFKPGQELSVFGGLNELLSALVMSRCFYELLPLKTLAQMVAYVEGTIPFRGDDAEGLSPFDHLAHRLQLLNERLSIGMSIAEQQQTIQDAVKLANQDVLNFSELDPRDFLDNTWDLIPETNMSLRFHGLYSVVDYRVALQKMSGFLTFLRPEYVYHQYQGAPSDERLAELTSRATKNLRVARDYLKVKLITASILEAFAMESGGDCPICLLMGELPRPGLDSVRLEQFLPNSSDLNPAHSDPEVWQLLDTGRNKETTFDLKNAPLSLFIYARCSEPELDQLSSLAHGMFKGEVSAIELLKAVPVLIRETIARGLSEMISTRASRVQELAEL